jgi:hypothetical protein
MGRKGKSPLLRGIVTPSAPDLGVIVSLAENP